MHKTIYIFLFCLISLDVMPYGFVIGAGIRGGVYATFAEALCNDIRTQTSNACDVSYTSGSYENISLLRSNQINFTIIQDDVLYNAYNGLLDFYTTGENKKLRKVSPIYPESLTIIVSADSAIKKLSDLKSKYIRLVGSHSGSLFTSRIYVDYNKWKEEDYRNVTYSMNYDETFNDMCIGALDAVVMMTGHINPLLTTYIKRCKLKFVQVDGLEFVMKKQYPYYFTSTIPASSYSPALKNVNTFATYAVLATQDDMSGSNIKIILDALLRVTSKQKNNNSPLLIDFNIKNAVVENISRDMKIKYHPSAIEYFKLKQIIN